MKRNFTSLIKQFLSNTMKYKSISFSFLFFGVLFSLWNCGVKKIEPQQFEGKFVYQLSGRMIDANAADSSNFQVVYAKDSLVRVENFTKLGKQIYIKHIPRNRAYILMDLGGKKVAVQTIPEPSPNDGKYVFNSKRKRKKIAGRKAQRVDVTLPTYDTIIPMYYLPEISPSYTEAIPGIAGLPALYTIFSNDEFVDYKLIYFEEKPIHKDYFGIPSDHEIMSLEEFIEHFND